MSKLSPKTREKLGWLVDDETGQFLEIFEQAIYYVSVAQIRDNTEKTNRKKTIANRKAAEKALANLGGVDQQRIDVLTGAMLGHETPTYSQVCIKMIEALREPLPKNNLSYTVDVLKKHVVIFIENGWLEPATSKTSPLVEVIQILIHEANVKQNAHSITRAAIAELENTLL